ncbi:hypothetical protein I553_6551 [Mycobacterium xenopi 4042]|uniref:Uncharacterized protein n=1 Tax=Mycobacterium xenopi 4042 TaxID=1299334 RepID=X8BGT0_MYCXE|nr:hypothetical protein I553_6551 [Mycobacterium xenopi 4042]
MVVDFVFDDDALFAHHLHAGVLVEPVHGLGGHERPAPQFGCDVADVEQRLQQPQALDIDGDVGTGALLIHGCSHVGVLGHCRTRQHTES